MIRFTLRMLANILFILGAVILVNDIYNSFVIGYFAPKLLGQHLFEYFPAQLGIAQAAIQRYVAAWIWDPVIQWLLNLPTFINLIGLGVIVYLPTIWMRRWM